MFKQLWKGLKKPALYTKTEVAFWDDEYISAQMLKAHLNPEFEAASRTKEFIDRSAHWIDTLVPPSDAPALLDVGCGPGIYGERFAQSGYQVTGVDFSQRSIAFAKDSAKKRGLPISYYYQNYLEMKLSQTYDFATLIYCDYGALSTNDRQTLMKNVYDHLKPGGKFLLDVYSTNVYDAFMEDTSWEICQEGGFWRKNPYVALYGKYKYPDNVTLEQTMISCDEDCETYYIWNTCFTKEQLKKEAENSGFHVLSYFGDMAGRPFSTDSDTIAVLLQRPY